MSEPLGTLERDATESSLTNEARTNLEWLLGVIAPGLPGIAAAMLGSLSMADGEDVAQEALLAFASRAMRGGLKCLDKRRITDIQKDELNRYAGRSRAYLIYLLKRTCFRFHRKTKSNFRIVGRWIDTAKEHETDPLVELIQREHADDVECAITSLPENLREILSLRYYARRSEKEIAAVLKISVSTVRRCLHKIREELRTALSEGNGRVRECRRQQQ